MLSVVMMSWLALSGCSDEKVTEQWDAWVEDNNTCEAVDDCELVYPGCPLGCASAVNVDAVDEAYEKSDALVRRYEFGGRSCDYDCAAAEVACDAGTCVVEYLDTW